MELENERLQRQLLLLQEQNIAAKNRRKDNREGRPRAKAWTSIDTKVFKQPPDNKIRAPPLITPIAPLDIDIEEILKNSKSKVTKIKVKRSPRMPLRSHTTSFYDPLKAKIDRDVGNTVFKKSGRKWNGENLEEEVVVEVKDDRLDNRNVSIETLLGQLPKDTVDYVPDRPHYFKDVVQKPVSQQSSKSDLPYYKNHLASARLSEIEKQLRDNYARTSQPNLKGDDLYIPRLNLLSAVNENTNVNEENEFIPLSSKTIDYGTAREGDRKGPQSRPQLIKETNQK